MKEPLQERLRRSKNRSNLSIPIFFNTSSNEQLMKFNDLLANNNSIEVYDYLESQLQELIKIRNPRIQFSPTEMEKKIQEKTSGNPITYGKWVYFPWLNNVVHILDEEEFIEVRTNRNRNKLTKKEQQSLLTKKVGIVGLSVGKTIAITMAMERSCGELRIADYDNLDLSNLNRLQTGIHNLGLPKTVIACREILAIDPYLKIKCFHEGLTEENMNDFFTKGGNLDLVVDECDGLDVKILLRQQAKKLRIPVLMDMNDRGTLDVERFDLEPNRSILHGMIDHLNLGKIKDLNNIEKIPYILPMLGADTISSKLKASMLEMGYTLNTWPQLSSAVMLGGAIAADTYRRIMLHQFTSSGRYWVDTEEIMVEKPKESTSLSFNVQPKSVSNSEQNKKWLKFIEECSTIDRVRNWMISVENEILNIEFLPFGSTSDFNYHLMDYLNAGLVIGSLAHLNNEDPPEFKLKENSIEIAISAIDEPRILKNVIQSADQNITKNLIKELDDLDVNYTIISEESDRKEFADILATAEKEKHLHKTWSHIYLNHIHGSSKLKTNSDAVGAFLNLSNDEEVIDLLNNWKGGEVFKAIYQNEFSIDKSYLIVAENISNRDNIVNLGINLLNIIKMYTEKSNNVIAVQSLPLLLANSITENSISESLKKFNKVWNGKTDSNLQPVFICRILS